jgi:hypothetical protein
MSPQYSSPARAVSRCRDALQVDFCTKYKLMHVKACIKSRYLYQFLPDGRRKLYCQAQCDIGDRTRITESVLRIPYEPGFNGIGRALIRYGSVRPRQITSINKCIKFNRMNGSPGDPRLTACPYINTKESLPLITVSRVIQPARRPAGRQQHKEIQ